MDMRAGGNYRWRWRNNESGQEFGFTGVMKEVVPPQKIVHTQIYDPGTMGGSMGDEAMSTGMTDGMEMSYQLLEKLLSRPGQ